MHDHALPAAAARNDTSSRRWRRRDRGTTLSQLRRRGEDALRGVDVPDPFDLDLFCRRLADSRGRAVRMVPLTPTALDRGPCGAWAATDTTDYLFYDPGTSLLHREHILLHEVGHLLAEHELAAPAEPSPAGAGAAGSPSGPLPWVGPDGALPEWLPDLSGEAVRHLFGRTGYSTPQEQEAEIIATLILERGSRRPVAPASSPDCPPEAVPVLGRFSRTLGARRPGA